jgi:mRNA-degrading endonuclease RelE of RelBE toxin-antitoxin system
MSTHNEAAYSLVVSRSAALALAERVPEKIAFAVLEFISGPLLENPRLVGKALREPFAPAFSARRGSYRVIYIIDEQSQCVYVTDIAHRAIAYKQR